MKDLERSFCTVCLDKFFNSRKLIEKLFEKGICSVRTVHINRKQRSKMIDDKHWKGEIAISFFQVTQWLANGWIIGHCCFYHLPFKEGMMHYQFRGEKWFQRSSLWLLVLRLPRFTIAAWVDLISWTSLLPQSSGLKVIC